ncbi:dioxygenase [Microbacterium sp. TNHR37B]|uniref:dioxygenase n=1 Tax=Microbacterium sp. TNHR37B TaxID=1775956 RepID=UPI0007B251BA|nr:dioxygenase [Microbacterium sp. TNHR37B]KZE90868.1 hypothetical protein AVP41_00389 [Microbacterium sp. TNHR37B]
MALGSGKKGARDARAARERARLYQARQEFQASIVRRRRRDNLWAGVAGGALILAVIGGQVAYYTLGPGQPEPVPTPTPTVGSPVPSDTPAPSDSPTPTPTP